LLRGSSWPPYCHHGSFASWASYLGTLPGIFIPCPDPCNCPIPLCEWPFLSLLFQSGADVTDGLNNSMSFIVSESRLTMILVLILLTLLLSSNVAAQKTIIPPAIPLAVRSPYLSCWNNHSNNAVFGRSWPTTINDTQVCHPRIVSWPWNSQLLCVRS